MVDFALGDRFGRSCSAVVIEAVEAILRGNGLTVARNRPYAGGHITASYGCPEADIHALQIEVRRGLYMDERTLMPHAALDDLRVVVRDLLVELGRFVVEELTPAARSAAALPGLPAGAQPRPSSGAGRAGRHPSEFFTDAGHDRGMSAVAPLRELRHALAVIGGLVVAALPPAVLADPPRTVARSPSAWSAPRTSRRACCRRSRWRNPARIDPVHGDARPWPWTVRSGPDSFYLPSKELALRKVRELRAAGRSNIDVGCMQINLGHHPTAFASLDEAFDPLEQRRLWRALLTSCTPRPARGPRRRALSQQRPDRGQAYRARVWRLWRDLRRRQDGDAPMIAEATFVGDRLARLAGGAAPSDSRPPRAQG